MTTITVVIPVLGRHHNAEPVVQSIAQNSRTNPKVLFICSPHDYDQIEACHATGAQVAAVHWDPGPADFAKKHNYACSLVDTDWVFAGADDLFFHEAWDTEALRIAELTEAMVIGTNDLANPRVMSGDHATHSLVSTTYVRDTGATWLDGPGVLYSPAYDHQSVDDELVAVARERGCWAFAFKSHVEHKHPIFSDTPMDATYVKALAKGAEDRRVFNQRRALARRSRAR